MMNSIETERLRLELLSTEFLQFLIDGDFDRANDLVSFRMSCRTSLTDKMWMDRRLRMIREDSSQHPWMYRAIVRKGDGEMVGHISFHHKNPDPDLAEFSKSGVELGYTIEPDYRRSGYARESILGMIEWAQKERTDTEVFVTISPANRPSMKLAESMGFIQVGIHEDEVDGLEYVMKFAAGERAARSHTRG